MHDVFPKANFRDCIAMTEKVGHITQMRIMRKEWIEQAKPRLRDEDVEDVEALEVLRSIEENRNGKMTRLEKANGKVLRRHERLIRFQRRRRRMNRCLWMI